MLMRRAAAAHRLAPPAAWSSALIAALIGFGGTVALVVQAGQAMGGSPVQIGSAVTALCLGIALGGRRSLSPSGCR